MHKPLSGGRTTRQVNAAVFETCDATLLILRVLVARSSRGVGSNRDIQGHPRITLGGETNFTGKRSLLFKGFILL